LEHNITVGLEKNLHISCRPKDNMISIDKIRKRTQQRKLTDVAR